MKPDIVTYIKIVKKYKRKDGTIAWYYDDSGHRFYPNELEYIIKSKRVPKGKEYITRFTTERVETNMAITSSGRMVSKLGKVETKRVYSEKPIIILTEDSRSGYTFYKMLLEMVFEDATFTFISSHGYGDISKYVRHYASSNNIVVIVDNKIEQVNVANIIDDIYSACKVDPKIHIFRPVSVEEVILSNNELSTKRESLLRDLIIRYMTTGEPYYTIVGKQRLVSHKLVDNLEGLLSAELSRISSISYTKSILSGCFLNRCCNIHINGQIRCSQYTNMDKITGYKRFSLAFGIVNIVGQILYNRELVSNDWSTEQKEALYR